MSKLLELVMIVKNSGAILRDVLMDIKPYIDHWTILDTGSVDGTQSLIKECLGDKSGNLYEEPFVNFLVTRNRSLELSSKECKYTIILDDSYILKGGSELRNFLSKNNGDCYSIRIADPFDAKIYYSNRIIRSNSGKKYEKYTIHEYIPDDEFKTVPVESYILDTPEVYHRTRSQKRFENDLALLKKHHEEDKKDVRILYYLGLTCSALGKKDEALEYFRKILEIKTGPINERYEALMYINENSNKKWEKREKQLFSIIKEYPYRIEPVYELFKHEYLENNLSRAYNYIKLCYNVKEPVAYPYPYNFDIYRVYIPYFYIDLSLKFGQIPAAVDALKSILKTRPHDQRFLNIKYSITDRLYPQSIDLSSGKTVVIHTGDIIFDKPWNPDNITTLGSGSEIMAINISKMLVQRGYRVFLFGYFKNSNVDYTGKYDGVEYYNYTDFNEFVQKYMIDCLIISRFANNLVYYDNVKKVYLWVHDVFPQEAKSIFQTHPTKFKGLLCLSNWQKQLNIALYKLPEKIVKITHNAIYQERFERQFEKVKNRFIWTSGLDRGVEYGINFIHKLRKTLKDATLHIFGNKYLLDINLLNELKHCDYIFLHDRVNQDKLAEEMLKSEYWLYTNNFTETYCISAVEAQMAKCIVVANVHAGLEDTIADRGVTVKGQIDDKNLNTLIQKVSTLTDEEKEKIIKKQYEFAKTQTYENLTNNWIKNIL